MEVKQPRTAPVALFGGTFDPVHDAHLRIAAAAADRFGVKVLFVPAAWPPHKEGLTPAAYEHRVRMLELACAADQRFEVSRIEEPTNEAVEHKSYSIVTIEKLLAAGLAPLRFLIGADAFAEIQSWHRWHDVVRSVTFIVVARPGARYAIPQGAQVEELTGIDSDVSSSAIRTRLGQGDYTVAVPDRVLGYIKTFRIYR